ncbi:MAG: hypothetical protein CVV64_12215 [Candidatus Wallbacteria bacterium HGW-Wallbacteria-1]|jgi:hypothetical protein|uniref:Hydantoinase n=1 Tax=Candidatus Wallbacteria bacterium HGW-Wallbacteria-1 TaxID=2013854 RepID=A0A2N1PNL2_9BACT|nr:MAG: hypothetical protein CVV64_12215 [Candidatus Wallbacteria bacterium HGW-Wallbacteria-1]
MQSANFKYRIGLDLGGTNLDGAILRDNELISTVKIAVASETPDIGNFSEMRRSRLTEDICRAINELVSAAGVGVNEIHSVNISTTLATNSVVTESFRPAAMAVQSGPGLPASFFRTPGPWLELSGYTDHRGLHVGPLDDDEICEGIERILSLEPDIEALGIACKFSTRNPETEKRIADIASQKGFSTVSCGYTLSGNPGFPARVGTVFLNASLGCEMASFANEVGAAVSELGILPEKIALLRADGSVMALDQAGANAVLTVGSGPGASVNGALALLKRAGLHGGGDLLVLDIGGTTTDAAFIAGDDPIFQPFGMEIGRYPTLVQSLLTPSIAIGGDWRLGGAGEFLPPAEDRRPLCRGGGELTLTDAMLANEDSLDAHESVIWMGRAALKIHSAVSHELEKINSKPIYTLRELMLRRSFAPEAILVMGAPARAMLPWLQKVFGVPCHLCPFHPVANAVGAACAVASEEATLIANTLAGTMSIPQFGISRRIGRGYRLEDGREELAELLGAGHGRVSFSEESCFSMIDYELGRGRNIRLRARVVHDTADIVIKTVYGRALPEDTVSGDTVALNTVALNTVTGESLS